MKRNTALKILNPILLALIVSQVLSGLFRIKLSHDTFELIHKNGGMVLIGLIVLHLVLNFNWVKANYFPKARSMPRSGK